MVVDHQPEVQDGAHQRRIERHRHARDEIGDHRRDGADIPRGARVDARKGDDEADHGAGQAQQHQAVGDVTDPRDPAREAHPECRAGDRLAVGAAPRDLGDVPGGPGSPAGIEGAHAVDLPRDHPNLAPADHEAAGEDREDSDREPGAVRGQDHVHPALRVGRAEQREGDEVEQRETQRQEISAGLALHPDTARDRLDCGVAAATRHPRDAVARGDRVVERV